MKNEEKVYELIEKYDFSELSKEQQLFLLSEITLEEYNEMRKTIELTSSYFDDEPVLMASDLVVPKINSVNIIVRAINYKLPMYKVAAMVAVIFSLSYIISNKPITTVKVAETNIESQSDIDLLSEYAIYSSNNSIRYNTGLSRVSY